MRSESTMVAAARPRQPGFFQWLGAPGAVAAQLVRRRELLLELAKRELTDRYAGQWLGAWWVIVHPLIMMGVYVVLFGVILQIKLERAPGVPGDYILYLLAGLIPWLALQDGLVRSCQAITGHATLVKQVVFPVEVLPLKSMVPALVSQMVALSVLVAYVLVQEHRISLAYGLLPLVVALQALLTIGLAYAVSAVAVYIRDLKDLVQVFGVVGLYLVPALYVPEWVPDLLRPVVTMNPFSSMVWCYQDVLYWGTIAHPWAWVAFPLTTLVACLAGAAVFRHLKTWFGNAL